MFAIFVIYFCYIYCPCTHPSPGLSGVITEETQKSRGGCRNDPHNIGYSPHSPLCFQMGPRPGSKANFVSSLRKLINYIVALMNVIFIIYMYIYIYIYIHISLYIYIFISLSLSIYIYAEFQERSKPMI